MTRKRWDAYVQEASKPAFELELEDGKVIAIEAPTGQQVIDAQRAAVDGDVEEQLAIICGDAADEVLALVKAAPGDAMGSLVTDIMKHFGYSVGKTRTRT